VPKNTKPVFTEQSPGALGLFHPAVRDWFESVFTALTRPQSAGWPPIARNESTLILAPIAAFLWCINRIMFGAVPAKSVRCRVVYISPIPQRCRWLEYPRRRFCRRRRTCDA
jgi:ATP-dependent Lhr-like helicase